VLSGHSRRRTSILYRLMIGYPLTHVDSYVNYDSNILYLQTVKLLSTVIYDRPENGHTRQLYIHCVSEKGPDIIDCNFKRDWRILTIFGTKIPETTGYQMAI